ncbi:glycosyltransferase family 2 protein [Candidatus Uhrbacteria bacterium]|nr:glycosyltransferase family 2 protein [Candidatus Uhrbacteria bacterium]
MISILIVHYNTPGLLRQTLRGFERCPPTVPFELVVVDNNPTQRVASWVAAEFPQVKLVVSEYNRGFGGAMNVAAAAAAGDYLFVFNPDIAIFPGVLEGLTSFLDENPDVGVVGPQLRNADGTVQYSCYRFMTPAIVLYRRLPGAALFAKARSVVSSYLMEDADHSKVQDVDYLLGASLFMRRTLFQKLGGFDPKLFMYFEDQDFCRRTWMSGSRVVYYPLVHLVHYHRRETAHGNVLRQLFQRLTRIQMRSAWYYFRKYKGQENPRRGGGWRGEGGDRERGANGPAS